MTDVKMDKDEHGYLRYPENLASRANDVVPINPRSVMTHIMLLRYKTHIGSIFITPTIARVGSFARCLRVVTKAEMAAYIGSDDNGGCRYAEVSKPFQNARSGSFV